MKDKLHKLRHTSFDELYVRGSQLLSAFAERRAWARSTKLGSDEDMLDRIDTSRLNKAHRTSALALRDHFRERTDPRFFTSFENTERTSAELRRRWPQAERGITERADRICEGRFDLLGFRDLSFGMPVSWHYEPIAGKRIPLTHWSRLNYLDANLVGDKKIVWELNRHQYFTTLGQAYCLTGNESYAETFAAHIRSWMDENPPKLGINWASSLEVAFRSISWLWSLYFFRNSDFLTPQLFLRICKFLYVSARHLETYPSTYFSPNTHLTGEALGLFYLGTLLPEFREAGRWRSSALQILLTQLARHVQDDGVYFEQSSYYHRYTTDFYLHLWILLRANEQEPSSELEQKLRLLLDHLMYITRPDGTTPLFGDDDGGRLAKLDDTAANDFRSTLATGAAIFQRPDYKFVSGEATAETLWLLGPAGLATFDRLETRDPAAQSKAFATGGYYVMRDGWKGNANYLLFDCGPHGTENCGHAHADALSLELSVKGRTLLVDPGTYTYTGSQEMRDWFRSTAAHNALTVDAESSSLPAAPFAWKSIAQSRCSSWITEPRFDYVSASHDGFNRLPSPATYQRSILFLKEDYWIIRDQVGSQGDHTLQFWMHFEAGVSGIQVEHNAILCAGVCTIAAFARNGKWTSSPGWISRCYGTKESAPAFRFSVSAKGSEEIVTFVVPDANGVPAPLFQEIQAEGGRAFEMDTAGRRDILLLRDMHGTTGRGRVKAAHLVSGFEMAWLRFDRAGDSQPGECVLIGGEVLEVNGFPLQVGTNSKFSYVRN